MLDELDRRITAALVRNGRASWRLIAEVLGQQERTVARRGNRLLRSGIVRVQAFPNPQVFAPVQLYCLQVRAAPSALRDVSRQLSARPEVHWMSALAGTSACVGELAMEPGALSDFLHGDLAGITGVLDYSLQPVFEYFRTVSGWRPAILTADQYERLSVPENPRYVTRYEPPQGVELGVVDRGLVHLLRANGRATLEELAARLAVSTTTVSRKLDALLSSGGIYVRAVLDPASLGYPVEAVMSVECAPARRTELGVFVADLPTTRWAACVADRVVVQTADASLSSLRGTMDTVAGRDGVGRVTMSLVTEIFKRTTVSYDRGHLLPVG